MAAVVHHNIKRLLSCQELGPEGRVGLAARADADLLHATEQFFAEEIDVHAIVVQMMAEVVLPKPDGAAALDSDLQEAHGLAPEAAEEPASTEHTG